MVIKYLYMGLHFLETKFSKKRKPIAVSFSITDRCNQQCLYCSVWKRKNKELPTKEILQILDELSKCGVWIIKFSGGEPLLRDDIGELIAYAKKNKFTSIWVNTNGLLVPEKINQLKLVDGLQISLDGPKKIHDYLCGSDSYDKVIEAFEIAQKNKIKIKIATTINKYNVDCIDYILQLAAQFKTCVCFQPLTLNLLDSCEPNPVLPNSSEYRHCIEKLILLKKKGNKQIYNSLTGLSYIYDWPKVAKLNCSAGRLFFRIDCSGAVWPCRNKNLISGFGKFSVLQNGLKDIIDNMPLPIFKCEYCGCAPIIEINHVYSFRLESIINLIKFEIA